jgi:hypothetical protein
MPSPASNRDDGPPAGWTMGVLFDALVPLAIGLVILAVAILVFLASSTHPAD